MVSIYGLQMFMRRLWFVKFVNKGGKSATDIKVSFLLSCWIAVLNGPFQELYIRISYVSIQKTWQLLEILYSDDECPNVLLLLAETHNGSTASQEGSHRSFEDWYTVRAIFPSSGDKSKFFRAGQDAEAQMNYREPFSILSAEPV